MLQFRSCGGAALLEPHAHTTNGSVPTPALDELSASALGAPPVSLISSPSADANALQSSRSSSRWLTTWNAEGVSLNVAKNVSNEASGRVIVSREA
jgi:hypothetical protein